VPEEGELVYHCRNRDELWLGIKVDDRKILVTHAGPALEKGYAVAFHCNSTRKPRWSSCRCLCLGRHSTIPDCSVFVTLTQLPAPSLLIQSNSGVAFAWVKEPFYESDGLRR